jgi:hypothetical protein
MFPQARSGRSVHVTIHFHKGPRSRMNGAISPLLQYVSIACTRTTLTLAETSADQPYTPVCDYVLPQLTHGWDFVQPCKWMMHAFRLDPPEPIIREYNVVKVTHYCHVQILFILSTLRKTSHIFFLLSHSFGLNRFFVFLAACARCLVETTQQQFHSQEKISIGRYTYGLFVCVCVRVCVSIIHKITHLNGPVTFYNMITDWKRKLPRKMYIF